MTANIIPLLPQPCDKCGGYSRRKDMCTECGGLFYANYCFERHECGEGEAHESQ